jgi:hypothetical protein
MCSSRANEFADNGNESKISLSVGTIFRNNYVHHKIATASGTTGKTRSRSSKGNTVEDNSGMAIFYEVSGRGLIRNHTIRRNGDNAISTSHHIESYGHRIENNFRGIVFFVDCTCVGSPDGGYIGEQFYMSDNVAHDDASTVGAQSGAFANGFSHTQCTATQVAP